MRRSTIGAGALLALILAVAVGAYYALPAMLRSQQVSTSDAARSKGVITIGMDNFVGYFPLCSEYMRQLMLADGYKVQCVDDKANYAERFERLRAGKLDLAVATVDTYVLGGQRTNYPGVIVSIIDESKGGDAILARDDAVANLTDLRTRLDLKVAFTPDSPSDHLRKAVGVDFDIPLLRSRERSWRIDTDGSEEARKKLLAGEAHVAVLWEPDISKALAKPGVIKLLGSEQTSKLIVDILIANRDYNDRYPDRVKLLLADYFKTLKYYRDNPERLRKDAASYASVSEAVAEQMLKGVAWVNLSENAGEWFGISAPGQAPSYGLFETIERTVKILKEFGDVSDNPLPNGDPRRIINSAALTLLATSGIEVASTSTARMAANPLETPFPPLEAAGWTKLREVGTLKVRPVLFPSGSQTLSLEDKKQVDETAEILKSYPLFWIEVQGHTRPGGDQEADKTLSQERAEAVARYLQVTYNISPNRLRPIGLGSTKVLPQQPGEADRAYRYRLSRVEIHLKAEVY